MIEKLQKRENDSILNCYFCRFSFWHGSCANIMFVDGTHYIFVLSSFFRLYVHVNIYIFIYIYIYASKDERMKEKGRDSYLCWYVIGFV